MDGLVVEADAAHHMSIMLIAADDRPPPELELVVDYRCPFAYLAHQHSVRSTGEQLGISFYNLNLGLCPDPGQLLIDPRHHRALLAMRAVLACALANPVLAETVHAGMFDSFHRDGRSLHRPQTIESVLAACGFDPALLRDSNLAAEVDRRLAVDFRRQLDRAVTGVPAWFRRGRRIETGTDLPTSYESR
ncbi:DsbA family protein [Nocardia sp. NPDC059228]|uniref:DsbA family protein n=1 Tax=Nocardia sp. NPDC059228 TaxID=3346777 RepID=UPI0036AAECB2